MRGEQETEDFAQAIVDTLNLEKNAEKGHWTDVPLHVLRKAREAEKEECVAEIDAYYHAATDADRIAALQRLEREAADEGASALFLFDVARKTRERLEA